MKAKLNKVTGFVKTHKLMALNIALLMAIVAVPVYGHYANKSLARVQHDAETKLVKQLELNKTQLSARLDAKKQADAVAATKAAEEAAAAKKAAEEAAAKLALSQKKQPTTTKKTDSYNVPSTGMSISISAGAVISYDGRSKVPISWSASAVSAKGYKLVWSTSPNPVYPGSDYGYYSEASASGSGYVKGTPGMTIYVRVCEYLGGGCGAYSNQLTIQL